MVKELTHAIGVTAMPAELTNYLQDELARRGWSATQLATRAGIPKQTVSNILNNPDLVPELPTYVSLAEGLGVSLTFLLERAGYVVERLDNPEESNRKIARQIEAFPWLQPIFQWLLDLDPEDRAGVVAYLESVRRQRGRSDQDPS
jgi:transcriptional regulator with XRE-family HTH domain